MTSAPGPIFVFGPSRSGTELVREVLNRHPAVHIAEETHYFDDLRPRIGGATPLSAARREEAAVYFARLLTGLYGAAPGEAARRRLADSPRFSGSAVSVGDAAQWNAATTGVETADGMFEAFCRAQAAERGKTIWGEKTPRHVFRGAEILAAFPDARLIATVRDPRAVVASYRDWRKHEVVADETVDEATAREARRVRASYSLTLSASMWAAAVQQGERLVAEFGPDRVRLLRYEDLVSAPEQTLRELCGWLGVDYAADMADVGMVNSTYLPDGAPGLHAGALDRWKHQLGDHEVGLIQLLTGRIARRNGYGLSDVRLRPVFVAGQLLATPFQLARAILANRGRIAGLPQYLLARAGALLGGSSRA